MPTSRTGTRSLPIAPSTAPTSGCSGSTARSRNGTAADGGLGLRAITPPPPGAWRGSRASTTGGCGITCGCSGSSNSSSRRPPVPVAASSAIWRSGSIPAVRMRGCGKTSSRWTLHVGAPPDGFNVDGQDWGLPPFIPWKLRAAHFEPFLKTVRAAMRGVAGLRVDHVMGLYRLFWIPPDGSPKTGAYVQLPAQRAARPPDARERRARVPSWWARTWAPSRTRCATTSGTEGS